MANLIALVNVDLARRPFVATLYHDAYCERRGACDCKMQGYTYAVGDKGKPAGYATGRRPMPRSITLLAPGDRVDGLHPAVLRLEQVRDAIRAGWLRADRTETPDDEIVVTIDGARDVAASGASSDKKKSPKG